MQIDAYLGEVLYVAFSRIIPSGYHVCDGSLLSIASYAALFALIGTDYGGDGIKNFALPHLPTPPGQHGLYLIAINGIYPS